MYDIKYMYCLVFIPHTAAAPRTCRPLRGGTEQQCNNTKESYGFSVVILSARGDEHIYLIQYSLMCDKLPRSPV